MTRYRTGNHWGVTIIRDGILPTDASNERRDDDEFVAVVVNGDRELAERICALLNADERPPGWYPYTTVGTDVPADTDRKTHIPGPELVTPPRWKGTRGTPPPPAGPGCVCDGSGRTCPRHGAVI